VFLIWILVIALLSQNQITDSTQNKRYYQRMNFFRFEFALFIMHVAVVQAFQPSLTRLIALRSAAMDSSILHSAYDPVSDMDLDHAHDCAENFGKCAIGDLEDMTKGKCNKLIMKKQLELF
jgi:hypothetical protein